MNMKKMYTKLFSTGLLMCLTLIGFTVKAQTSNLTDNGTVVTAVAKSTAVATAPADVKTEAKAEAEGKTIEKAAKAEPDTAWKPQRRLWGYAFGDLYFNAHGDAANRGGETQYNGVPTYRNAFQFRRLYLGYDYEITKKIQSRSIAFERA